MEKGGHCGYNWSQFSSFGATKLIALIWDSHPAPVSACEAMQKNKIQLFKVNISPLLRDPVGINIEFFKIFLSYVRLCGLFAVEEPLGLYIVKYLCTSIFPHDILKCVMQTI